MNIFCFFHNWTAITAAQNSEIDSNLTQEQFLGMLKSDIQAAIQRKCIKVSGNDNAYSEAVQAIKEAKNCINNWMKTDRIYANYRLAQMFENNKPFIKR